MQSTNSHPAVQQRPPHLWALSKIHRLEIALFLTVLALLAVVALPPSSRAADLVTFLLGSGGASQPVALVPANDPANADARADPRAVFEQNARQLAKTGSPEAFQKLVQTLNQSEPTSHRDIAVALLKDASPEVVPVLQDALLLDADAGVRAGAAQVLGMRREHQAIPSLIAATHDSKWRVRRQAVLALNDLYAWQALPWLQKLQVIEGNLYARQAADFAVAGIKAKVAREIGAEDHAVVEVSVTASAYPHFYAITRSDLYARSGATWQRVSQLPDTPLALATGADENLLYLATVQGGLYRSADGGVNWQHVQFGLSTPTQLTVTAIAIDPQNSRHLYAALATRGAEPDKLNPTGIVSSADAGSTWTWLEDLAMYGITSRIILDPETPGVLFGMAGNTPWGYELPDSMCHYCLD